MSPYWKRTQRDKKDKKWTIQRQSVQFPSTGVQVQHRRYDCTLRKRF